MGAMMKGSDLPIVLYPPTQGDFIFQFIFSLELGFFGLKKKKQAVQSLPGSRDVISDLPEDVMNLILERLPLITAVRMSILLRKWRYKWVSIPDIVFDENCLVEASEMKRAHVVDQVLLHHVGPIRKFSSRYYVPSCGHIDRWIVFLSRNGIKKLILRITDDFNGVYDVHSSIFNCKELCHLELSGCYFYNLPPTFKGFHNLTVLDLGHIDLFSADEAASLISKCPLLERLSLRAVYFLSFFNINAPNLRYLDLDGTFIGLSVGSSPLLTVVSIELHLVDAVHYFEETETCHLLQFIGCSHGIERLALKNAFLQLISAGSIPAKLSPRYDHLTHLDIGVFDSKETLAALCTLRSSPNLKELKIECSFYGEWERLSGNAAEFWGAQKQFDCLLSHLEAVEIIGIYGILFDLEFIRYLLASAPVLKTMKINTNDEVKADEVPMILKELLQFRRASTQAEIIYLGSI